MPHEPRQASIARCVSSASVSSPLLMSHTLSTMRTRGSSIPATTSRVASSDFPTFTTTSSHTSSTERTVATMGKLRLMALRTRVNPDSKSAPELQVIQSAVQPVGGEQIGMRAALHDPPFGEHDDEVRVLHRGEPVRDDEDRAVRHQSVDRLLDQPLGFGVERAGRLVENQDG